ncbi:MAG: DUF2892 domain-containing protein [Gammaproteobacteria bacterium]|nr:DUF2892 domain-containing protein [Gammaproteobacteria bacterium]
MEFFRTKLRVVQNIGLMDRGVRVLAGIVLLGGGFISMVMIDANNWGPYAMLISIYPFLTSGIGWDPLYAMFGTRTCTLESGRNQCGTLPYEVDAKLGNKPIPDVKHDHSLYGSNHAP